MTQQPLLPIGDFALATSLPAQTLRYYHSEGLLVPAEVDEDTGYRAYTFNQVHQAVLVVALRRAAVSIRDIRALLDAPDLLPGLLAEHRTVLERRRRQEDTAMAQAAQLAAGWPTAEGRDRAPVMAVSRRVPGEAVGSDGVVLPQHVRAAADALQRELADAGMTTSGPAWCQYALESTEDKAKVMTPQGPDWMVAADLRGLDDGSVPLPADAELQDCPGRRERVVLLPATPTMVTLAAALDHLTRTSLEQDLVPDLGRLRYLLGPDHVELALTVDPHSEN
ncbi:hypothetical protein GCM10009616_14910 [Microlunatus lacustris]